MQRNRGADGTATLCRPRPPYPAVFLFADFFRPFYGWGIGVEFSQKLPKRHDPIHGTLAELLELDHGSCGDMFQLHGARGFVDLLSPMAGAMDEFLIDLRQIHVQFADQIEDLGIFGIGELCFFRQIHEAGLRTKD